MYKEEKLLKLVSVKGSKKVDTGDWYQTKQSIKKIEPVISTKKLKEYNSLDM